MPIGVIPLTIGSCDKMLALCRATWRATVDLVLPPRCAFCGMDIDVGDGEPLFCARCLPLLASEVGLNCRRCGALASVALGGPDRTTAAERSDAAERARVVGPDAHRLAFPLPRCPNCRTRPYHFDAAIPLGPYRAELRDAVLRMKQRTGDHLAVAMGDLYAERRDEGLAAFRPDVVVPVPMFWGRQMLRGTNSPEILSARISRHLGVPWERSMLVRRRNTLPQSALSPTRRFENVRGAFRLRRSYAITGARVVLVDDVLTTGATCSEAARALKEAGAESVVAAVVARTVPEE